MPPQKRIRGDKSNGVLKAARSAPRTRRKPVVGIPKQRTNGKPKEREGSQPRIRKGFTIVGTKSPTGGGRNPDQLSICSFFKKQRMDS